MGVLLDFVLVFVGGGIGASLRYGMMFIPYEKEDLYGFSLITFLINLMGSFIIGFVAEASSEKIISNHFITFLKIGVLGGFTTFSSFSLDNLEMLEKGRYVTAGVYISLSVLVCLAGTFLGQALAKTIFKKA